MCKRRRYPLSQCQSAITVLLSNFFCIFFFLYKTFHIHYLFWHYKSCLDVVPPTQNDSIVNLKGGKTTRTRTTTTTTTTAALLVQNWQIVAPQFPFAHFFCLFFTQFFFFFILIPQSNSLLLLSYKATLLLSSFLTK